MNDTYVYVLTFNIYFHYTIENAKLKVSNALWALGGNDLPNEQCKIKNDLEFDCRDPSCLSVIL